jgi:hypothetical protein
LFLANKEVSHSGTGIKRCRFIPSGGILESTFKNINGIHFALFPQFNTKNLPKVALF